MLQRYIPRFKSIKKPQIIIKKMSKSLSDFVSAYRMHFINLGFIFLKSQNNSKTKNGDHVSGQWIMGPLGTSIFAYVQDSWSDCVVGRIFEQIEKAYSYPSKISDFIQNAGRVEKGMNYFTDEVTLGQAIRSLKLDLTSYFHEKNTFQGTTGEIIFQHLKKLLSIFKGDPHSATVYDNFASVSTSIYALLANQQTKGQVLKMSCPGYEKQSIRGEFTTSRYLKTSKAFINEIIGKKDALESKS